jgi:hypothetical protein
MSMAALVFESDTTPVIEKPGEAPNDTSERKENNVANKNLFISR